MGSPEAQWIRDLPRLGTRCHSHWLAQLTRDTTIRELIPKEDLRQMEEIDCSRIGTSLVQIPAAMSLNLTPNQLLKAYIMIKNQIKIIIIKTRKR
jgi:hypothetical protein